MEYSYIAYSQDNEIVNGAVAAATERSAQEYLVKLGYRILSLKAVKRFSVDWHRIFPSFVKVKPDTVIVFSRQLATLIDAGINAVTALELLHAQAANPVMQNVLDQVLSSVRSGQRLSDAMSKHPTVFSPLFCRSLTVGEQSGELSKVLRQIAEYMEKGVSTRKSLKSALTYPAIVAGVAVLVIILLVSFVFPAFIGLYNTFGVEIPAATRVMLGIISFLQKAGLYLLGILGGGILVFLTYIRRPKGKYWWDGVKLKLPLLGPIMLLQELATCCRTMAILFRTGLPLAGILDVAIESSDNLVVNNALQKVRTAVYKGEGLSRPMAQNKVFLPMMVEMVKVGEETGTMDTSLSAVTQNYDTEADNRTRALVAIIQPAVTMVIAGVVFFIVISMVSLMYSIYGQMS